MENREAEVLETTETADTGKTVDIAEAAEEVTADEAEKKPLYPTQTVLTIRAIVGAYVIYLAYQIMTSDSKLGILMWAAVALFIVAGSGLVIMSVKHFICGEYEGGKKDI